MSVINGRPNIKKKKFAKVELTLLASNQRRKAANHPQKQCPLEGSLSPNLFRKFY